MSTREQNTLRRGHSKLLQNPNWNLSVQLEPFFLTSLPRWQHTTHQRSLNVSRASIVICLSRLDTGQLHAVPLGCYVTYSFSRVLLMNVSIVNRGPGSHNANCAPQLFKQKEHGLDSGVLHIPLIVRACTKKWAAARESRAPRSQRVVLWSYDHSEKGVRCACLLPRCFYICRSEDHYDSVPSTRISNLVTRPHKTLF
ncbi:hypothetical protein BC827DRAFT_256436 [Russula dissimulans]|nr:hypothetical protein BC827DRAFT_256436 [Russula dissimulans]